MAAPRQGEMQRGRLSRGFATVVGRRGRQTTIRSGVHEASLPGEEAPLPCGTLHAEAAHLTAAVLTRPLPGVRAAAPVARPTVVAVGSQGPFPSPRQGGARTSPVTGHRQRQDIASVRASPAPGHRQRQSIASARTSPASEHRQRQDIASARISPAPGHRQRQSIASARISPAPGHRQHQEIASVRASPARTSPASGHRQHQDIVSIRASPAAGGSRSNVGDAQPVRCGGPSRHEAVERCGDARQGAMGCGAATEGVVPGEGVTQ
ncbi:uncharacterized protein LOC135092347 [Scylla paramamosain]|uniref:uncharacterized protein LOC135092347 n=1 Tax=Scylla paramamosain TaxID=85552 RepID=UPI003082C15B